MSDRAVAADQGTTQTETEVEVTQGAGAVTELAEPSLHDDVKQDAQQQAAAEPFSSTVTVIDPSRSDITYSDYARPEIQEQLASEVGELIEALDAKGLDSEALKDALAALESHTEQTEISSQEWNAGIVDLTVELGTQVNAAEAALDKQAILDHDLRVSNTGVTPGDGKYRAGYTVKVPAGTELDIDFTFKNGCHYYVYDLDNNATVRTNGDIDGNFGAYVAQKDTVTEGGQEFDVYEIGVYADHRNNCVGDLILRAGDETQRIDVHNTPTGPFDWEKAAAKDTVKVNIPEATKAIQAAKAETSREGSPFVQGSDLDELYVQTLKLQRGYAQCMSDGIMAPPVPGAQGATHPVNQVGALGERLTTIGQRVDSEGRVIPVSEAEVEKLVAELTRLDNELAQIRYDAEADKIRAANNPLDITEGTTTDTETKAVTFTLPDGVKPEDVSLTYDVAGKHRATMLLDRGHIMIDGTNYQIPHRGHWVVSVQNEETQTLPPVEKGGSETTLGEDIQLTQNPDGTYQVTFPEGYRGDFKISYGERSWNIDSDGSIASHDGEISGIERIARIIEVDTDEVLDEAVARQEDYVDQLERQAQDAEIAKLKAELAKERTEREDADTAEAKARTDADTELQKALDEEIKAREAAIEALQKALAEETKARTEAVADLQKKLNAETKARTEGDKAEAKARTEAITALQKALDAEVKARTEAIADLQKKLDAETKARVEGDAAEVKARTEAIADLQKKLDAETKARTDALAEIEKKLGVEVKARTEADAALQKALDAEIKAREAAIETLEKALKTATTEATKAIEVLQKALEAEKKARTDGDAAETKARTEAIEDLQKQLDAEVEARTKAIEAIEKALEAEKKERVEGDAAEIKARTEAITELQKKLDAETKARTEAINELQKKLDAETKARTEADAAEAKARAEADAAEAKARGDADTSAATEREQELEKENAALKKQLDAQSQQLEAQKRQLDQMMKILQQLQAAEAARNTPPTGGPAATTDDGSPEAKPAGGDGAAGNANGAAADDSGPQASVERRRSNKRSTNTVA